jgi:hypothetical protein
MSQFNHNLITTIIDRYGLEFDDYQVEQIVATWLQKYDSAWIIKAIVESLHRGRYKVVSVDSILSGWQRAGKPSCKFTAEFEREILQNLPIKPDPMPPELPSIVEPINPEETELAVIPLVEPLPQSLIVQPTVLDRKYLNPEESAPFQHHSHSISAAQSTCRPAEVAPAQRDHTNSSISQSPSSASSDTKGEESINRIAPQPAKFQLFNTLKSIVDPNYQPLVHLPPLDIPQIYPEVTLPQIVRLNLPLSNVSGGKY